MIIVCDSCGARFHLADGRVGPRGAKVRCSNCHHSFQVAPPAKAAEVKPAARAQNSPRPAPAEAKRAAAGRGREALGDPDLDNPEFLFDPSDDTPGSRSVPENVPFSRKAPAPAGDVTQRHEPAAPESDDTPAARHAPTPLMGLDPEVSARQEELNRDAGRASESAAASSAGDATSPFDFRHDDFEATPVPGREPSLVAPPPRRAAAAPASDAFERDADGEPDTLVRLAGEDIDEAISRWDGPVSRPAPRREPARGQRVEVLRTPPAPAPPEQKLRPAPSADVEPDELPRTVPIPPTEPFPTPLWLQLVIAVVGFGLIASAGRASLRPSFTASPRDFAVEGQGWIAEHLSARPARDAAGDPVVEVEGSLRASSGVVLPGVRLTPLDASGTAVGAPTQARVAGAGFAATLADSSARARTLRIEITAPAPPDAPPAESTTAALPVAPPTEPSQAPPASPAPAP
jgi:predicted Zn finger-like uncharacterized protein